MEPAPSSLQAGHRKFRPANPRPLCIAGQRSNSLRLLEEHGSKSGGNRCPNHELASGFTLYLSPIPPPQEDIQTDSQTEGRSDSDCSSLAAPPLVSSAYQPVGGTATPTAKQLGHAAAGTTTVPHPQPLLTDSLAFQWHELKKKGYPEKVFQELLASR